jgi:hypothetical protein
MVMPLLVAHVPYFGPQPRLQQWTGLSGNIPLCCVSNMVLAGHRDLTISVLLRPASIGYAVQSRMLDDKGLCLPQPAPPVE